MSESESPDEFSSEEDIESRVCSLVQVFKRRPADWKKDDEEDEEMVIDPLPKARKIFVRPHDNGIVNTTDDGFKELSHPSVPMSVYQEVVRRKYLDVLSASGVEVNSFTSIDCDEVFWQLTMKRQGKALQHLAERYSYRMPIAKSAFLGFADETFPTSVFGEPLRNDDGYMVSPYVEYSKEFAESIQEFRHVDEIRILHRRLGEWVDIAALVEQGVLTMQFIPRSQSLHRKLAKSVWSLRQVFSHDHIHFLRDFFGEEIAFYFCWFRYYILALIPLSIVAGIVLMLRPFISLTARRYTQTTFSFLMVAWCAALVKVFGNRVARINQQWGMAGYEAYDTEISSYDSRLRGSWRQWILRMACKVVTASYCILIIAGVFFIQIKRQSVSAARPGQEQFVATYGAVLTTIQIKVLGFVWSYIALWLTNAENHRTHFQWQSALSLKLIEVKLFNALYPFMYTTFLQRFVDRTCGHSLEEIMTKVPHVNVTLINSTKWIDYHPHAVFFDRGTQDVDGMMCLSGCYPIECENSGGGCFTNCYRDLQANLLVYFPSHVAFTICFLIVQILLRKYSVWKEEREAREMRCSPSKVSVDDIDSDCDSLGRVDSRGRLHEGTLERQAKSAPYEYMSWGGSMVEDFLELAIGFAVTVCFGLVLPVVLFMVLFGHCLEYFLIHYRMVIVTQRPFPYGADGIGPWKSIFDNISVIGIISNVGIACFFEHPLREQSKQEQLIAFLLLEHGMLLVREFVKRLIPDQPTDVDRVRAYNNKYLLHHYQKTPLEVDAGERYNTRGILFGLN